MSEILVSGLTIIRNGVRLNYPFVEAIRSALSICDEYIVVAGDSDDETLEYLAALDDDRIRVIHTEWSPLVSPRKCLLAQQTNIGLGFCRGRWCLYLQGNEVLHEKDLPHLRSLMETHAQNPSVEAMLVERLTFWSDYDHYVAAYPRRFKYTARIIRPYIGTYSIRDGMSFAVFDNFSTKGRYPNSIDTGADLYRYDYVHSVEQQARKFADAVHRTGTSVRAEDNYYYEHYPRQFLARFEGTHPAVMAARQRSRLEENRLDLERCRRQLSIGERKRLLESYLYTRFGLPSLSRNRFRLAGSLVRKDRPDLGAFNGTLRL
jgi:glycosyltransferase involved in cell wall biosynthesis